jgi:drug/metabolite transporter (DMT)-like permease
VTLTVVLAFISAMVVGAGDWLGGRQVERTSAYVVTIAAQCVTGGALVVAALVVGTNGLRAGDIGLGLVAGFGTALGYVVFFRILSIGRNGIVAPVTALTTSVVGFAVDLLDGTRLSTGAIIGLMMAIIAVPVLAWGAGDGHRDSSVSLTRTLVESVASGAAFALWFVLIARTSSDSGLWPPVMTSVVAIIILSVVCWVTKTAITFPRLALLSGALGFKASVCVTIALRRGPQSVATVIASLYPITTVACAWRFGHERIRWWHGAGLVLAMSGVAVLTLSHA